MHPCLGRWNKRGAVRIEAMCSLMIYFYTLRRSIFINLCTIYLVIYLFELFFYKISSVGVIRMESASNSLKFQHPEIHDQA